MYSVFGVAAMVGVVFVSLFQVTLGYSGMILVCLGFSGLAGILTYFYRFDIPYKKE